jgi:hypothetical protein
MQSEILTPYDVVLNFWKKMKKSSKFLYLFFGSSRSQKAPLQGCVRQASIAVGDHWSF